MIELKNKLFLLIFLGLMINVYANRIEETEGINNSKMVIEYDVLNAVVSKTFFNAEGQEIYNASFPNIRKTPDKLDENGLKTGFWTIFLNTKFRPEQNIESAQYYRKAEYRKGTPVGIVKDYFMSGSIQFEGKMISEFPSVYDGVIKIYNTNGNVNSQRTYENGKIIYPESYNYFINDEKVDYDTFSKVEIDGTYTIQFIKNGNLSEQFQIKNGTKDGMHAIYDVYNKRPKGITNYSNGIKNGYEKVYDHFDRILEEGNWVENRKQGDWKFYKNGVFKNTKRYENGKHFDILDLNEISVFDFVLIISYSDKPLIVKEINAVKWNIQNYLPALFHVIDFEKDVYKVFSEKDTPFPKKLKSTMSEEIMYIIEGFFEGVYPPRQISRNEIQNMKEEYKAWWDACKYDFIK